MNTFSRQSQKTEKLNIQLTMHQKEVISKAAQLRNITLNEFVLEKIYGAAQEVVSQEPRFFLSDEKWDAFCQALDAPPKDIASLKKLLHEPS